MTVDWRVIFIDVIRSRAAVRLGLDAGRLPQKWELIGDVLLLVLAIGADHRVDGEADPRRQEHRPGHDQVDDDVAAVLDHHQSVVEEYHATHEQWRWMHLVCGAQAAAISFGKNMAVYEEVLDLLHAA